MPVDIKELTEGWLELESDPGLFSLLLEDFGVKGVQVEEIYDIYKPFDGPIYGFIFLFRWVEERRSRRKIVEQTETTFVKDEEIVNNIFFAQQMVPNSCATHALVSILLNCSDLNLGHTLERLRTHTRGMCPENKGWAIGNTPELAKAHNSHAMPQAKRRLDKSSSVSTGRFTGEAFHFISFVPIGGRLFELDGLKPFPIDHGPWSDIEQWTDKFRSVIADRLASSAGDESTEIRFNLMAVVPDRRLAIHHKLKMLKTNRQIVLNALRHLVKKRKDKSTNRNNSKANNDEDSFAATTSCGAGDEDPLSSLMPDADQTTSTTIANSKNPMDYATPLTIETSPAPSTSGTDTSSEVGSAFNSPTQLWATPTTTTTISSCGGSSAPNWANSNSSSSSASSPSTRDLKKFVVMRMAEQDEELVARKLAKKEKNTVAVEKKTDLGGESSHNFAPQDLIALMRNLENEICMCELHLKDENDKHNKYKIDDSRRTHNYDEFICTFLSMLAEQGKLADLVEQHLVTNTRRHHHGGGYSGGQTVATGHHTRNAKNSTARRNNSNNNNNVNSMNDSLANTESVVTKRRRGRGKVKKRR